MEKQAYALVKAIKDFRVYILYSHVIAYVPNVAVKDILFFIANGKPVSNLGNRRFGLAR